MSALLAAAGASGTPPVTKPGGGRALPKREPGDDPAVLSLAAALLPPLPSPPAPTAPVASVGDAASGTGGATAGHAAAPLADAANLPGPVPAPPASSAQEVLANLAQEQNLALESPLPEGTAPANAASEEAPQAAPAPDPVAGRNPQLAFGIRLSAAASPATPQPAASATPGHDSATDGTQAPGPISPSPVAEERSPAKTIGTARPALGQGTSNQSLEPDSRHPLPTGSSESASAVAAPASLQPAIQTRGNAPQQAAPTAATPPPAPSEPPREPAIRELSLSVSSPSVDGRAAGQVSLRVVERGGEVQVAVHTTDPQLAGDLRQNLPDLVSELSGRGYRADTWQPLAGSGADSSALPRAAGTAAGSSAGQSYSGQTGDGSRNGGGPAGQQQQQQRHGQDPNQPSWLQALTRGAAQTGSTPYDDHTR